MANPMATKLALTCTSEAGHVSGHALIATKRATASATSGVAMLADPLLATPWGLAKGIAFCAHPPLPVDEGEAEPLLATL